MSGAPPVTLGTAGHIDHGKTALVKALTGTDTDRLPQEKARGISIELGFAQLELPDGRRLSIVDVPGHERFVRTMVAGATGIDMFLLTVAADDGVMPQTREHAAVLRALAVRTGVAVVTKADLVAPERAAEEVRALMPDTEVVACSARTGAGLDTVRAALARAAATLPGRAHGSGPAVLHVDRSFTIRGAGTVVTGTLWSGALERGDTVELLPRGRAARVRAVQVHDEAVERAQAGQRVAVNLAGVARDEVARGDAVVGAGSDIAPAWILDAALDLPAGADGARVHVHHGTRETPARLVSLGAGFWQVRAQRPLLARAGDRVVVRSIAPRDTIGGGAVVDPAARHHGARGDVVARLERLRRGEREPTAAERGRSEPRPTRRSDGVALTPAALALEQRLLAAGLEPPNDGDLGDETSELAALRAAGRVVRLGRGMHIHADALATVRRHVERIVERDGDVTLARLRDELGTSRKYAQALLEALDAARVTLRLADDRRLLRRRTRA